MHSLLRSRKAQFFLLSAFAIVTIAFFVSKWIEPYTIIDTSSVILNEETFLFNNIKEKSEEVIKGGKSCEELKYNLEEYKNFVEDYTSKKNYKLDFDYVVSSCNDGPPLSSKVVIYSRLKSTNMVLLANYTVS
jgi:hypothetical protein